MADVLQRRNDEKNEEITIFIREKHSLIDYNLKEESYIRLARAMKFFTGMREKMEGINLVFPMTIPTVRQDQGEKTSQSQRSTAKVPLEPILVSARNNF